MKGKIRKSVWYTPTCWLRKIEYYIEYICEGVTSRMVVSEKDMVEFMSDINKDWLKIKKGIKK